jgi:hypothetical protein
MFVSVAMTLLCTASIGFYTRFFVELFKERKPTLGGYWIRLKLDAAREAITESRERNETTMPRAA